MLGYNDNNDQTHLPGEPSAQEHPHRDPSQSQNPPLLRALSQIVMVQLMMCIAMATALVLLHTFSPSIYGDLSRHLTALITTDDGFEQDTAVLRDRLQEWDSTPSEDASPQGTQSESPTQDFEHESTDDIALPPSNGNGVIELSHSLPAETLWGENASFESGGTIELLGTEPTAVPANATVESVSYPQSLSFPMERSIFVTSPYGHRKHPITGEMSFHTGVDLRAPEGEPIHAPAAGTVIAATKGEKLGNYVKLRHADGGISVYGHCRELLVKEGETVKAGQVIAKVGSTGSSTAPHLHLSFLMGGQYVNPGYVFKDVPI